MKAQLRMYKCVDLPESSLLTYTIDIYSLRVGPEFGLAVSALVHM